MAVIMVVRNYNPKTLEYRKGVPKDIQPIVGRVEWKHSLRCFKTEARRLREAEKFNDHYAKLVKQERAKLAQTSVSDAKVEFRKRQQEWQKTSQEAPQMA